MRPAGKDAYSRDICVQQGQVLVAGSEGEVVLQGGTPVLVPRWLGRGACHQLAAPEAGWLAERW
jgi:hypothetical protein